MGLLVADVWNEGTVVPRSDDGVLSIIGDYQGDGLMRIVVEDEMNHGRVSVNGVATLGGHLEIEFYAAPVGVRSVYRFLDADEIIDASPEVTILGIDPSLVRLNLGRGRFVVVPEPTPVLWLVTVGALCCQCRRSRGRTMPARE